MARPQVSKTPLGQRLTDVRKKLGFEARQPFAHLLEMHPDTLGGYERGDTEPDSAFMAMYKRRFGVNISWLVTGDGEMFGDNAEVQGLIEGDFARIPAYDHRYSAGHGAALALEGHPDHEIALSRRWLRRLGVKPDQAILAYADGDSMTPTIPDKAPMLIDMSSKEVRHGLIYAFSLENHLIVKRINRLIDGSIELISDNREKYPPQIVMADRLEQMQIIGRVVMAIQQF